MTSFSSFSIFNKRWRHMQPGQFFSVLLYNFQWSKPDMFIFLAKTHQDNFMTDLRALTTWGTALVLIFTHFIKIPLLQKSVIIFLNFGLISNLMILIMWNGHIFLYCLARQLWVSLAKQIIHYPHYFRHSLVLS